MIDEILNDQNFLEEIEQAQTLEDLLKVEDKYLWKSWVITQAFKQLKTISDIEQKKQIWQKLSNIKAKFNELYEKKHNQLQTLLINQELSQDLVDLSVFITQDLWHYNLLVRVRRQLEDICMSMWFKILTWFEVVTKYENFEAVNIPLTHPATDMHDTFYLEQKDSRWENLVLRTQTSAMQNALIRKYKAPLKAVIPWKVYRYEDMDASHDCMFYQLEWMYIDKNVSIWNFKKMITDLLSELFGFEVKIRMRPGYFPFVEPWFEIDATCPLCKWKWCWLCKNTWWIEIVWAWMIHPQVIKEWWLDSEVWNWFAFGVWVSRVVAIKYSIWDIRLFTNGDLRFARSFD